MSIKLPSLNETESRKFIENIVWPDGPVCHRCKGKNVYLMEGKSTRPGLHKCRDCRKPFTVTTGSIFEGTHMPLSKWVLAFHLLCSSKKGFSSHQLHRVLGISYESAWFMTHRIRLAMSELKKRKLNGDVEVDETFVGGKERNKHKNKKLNAGRGSVGKTPVLALVSRNGKVRSQTVPNVTAKTLQTAIKENVHKDSRIITDEWRSYRGIGDHFAGGHETVNHGAKQYVEGDVYTNTVECYFSLLKRGIHGTFHHVSPEHLNRYCHEFDFRWNNRRINDTERTEKAIGQVKGKRLMYKDRLPEEEVREAA